MSAPEGALCVPKKEARVSSGAQRDAQVPVWLSRWRDRQTRKTALVQMHDTIERHGLATAHEVVERGGSALTTAHVVFRSGGIVGGAHPTLEDFQDCIEDDAHLFEDCIETPQVRTLLSSLDDEDDWPVEVGDEL